MNFSWHNPNHKPLIIGHRGSSAYAPENTITSFLRAIKDRSDAIELDIRILPDNYLIVIHDKSINRTTNGRGNVSKLTLDDIKRYDAGSWFDARYAGEKIPTLQEVLKVCKGKVGINIEIKSEVANRTDAMIINNCLNELKRYRNNDDILISSFNKKILEKIREQNSNISLGYLYDPIQRYLRNPIKQTMAISAEYLIVSNRIIRKRLVEEAHDAGVRVGVYTVNTRKQLSKVLQCNIDVVITNDPLRTRQMLESINKKAPK
jgi:glycerophosphoryl diester phosphodiesterase